MGAFGGTIVVGCNDAGTPNARAVDPAGSPGAGNKDGFLLKIVVRHRWVSLLLHKMPVMLSVQDDYHL